MKVSVITSFDTRRVNSHYAPNRDPLLPNPLTKLPLGTVQARGWLAHQLELMADGMVGCLESISQHLAPGNGWLDPSEMDPGKGWEEQPYWLRGFHDLAVLTGRENLLDISRKWIEAVFASRDPDGYFGPQSLRYFTGQDGTVISDLWSHTVMTDALIHHHEYTGDERVLSTLEDFCQYCANLPDEAFMPVLTKGFVDPRPNVQRRRAGDFIPQIHWLYNRTGESRLLDLATRCFRRIAPPTDEFLDRHIVNFTQRFSYPGYYYVQSRNPAHLDAVEYWYAQHMASWGQQPRGIFGADEQVRPGKTDPRQGFETCGFVEFAKSNYELSRITGNTVYADRTEDLFFNHFPASQTPDLKGLHYLTASNLPSLDANDHDYFNRGRQVDYSPHGVYRCCQHNVAMGWPWFVENLWQATADNGLAAWIYAPSSVNAMVGEEGVEVSIDEETDYPFRDRIRLNLRASKPVTFPLYLRIPKWCRGFAANVNGKQCARESTPGACLRIEREWRDGDTVEIVLPMEVSLTRWPRNAAVTVDRGPLSYSVRITERWSRFDGGDGTDEWPDWEVLPEDDWNYGLVLNCDGQTDPCTSMEVSEPRDVAEQPWTVEAAPVEIRAAARKIPKWRIGEDNTIQPLHPGPIRSDEPAETITLVPLGCARLRVACLPVIGEGREAVEWPESVKFSTTQD